MAAGTKLTGAVGAFYLSADSGTDVTGEAVGTGDGETVGFALDNVNVDAVTIYVDAVAQAPGAVTVTPAGSVTFAEAPAQDAVITANYTYYAMAEVLGFFEWEIEVNAPAIDATDFDSGGWEESVAPMSNWRGSAKRYYETATLGDRAGDRGIFKFFLDDATADMRFEGWGSLVSFKSAVKPKELVTEEISMAGSDALSQEIG